jgi:ABC-type branched-subunit amino acid transport system substrate-binding protein
MLMLAAALLMACLPLSRPWSEIVVAPGQPILLGFSVDADAETGSSVQPALAERDATQVAGHRVQLVPITIHCQADRPAAVAPSRDSITGLAGYVGTSCSGACVYAEGLLYEERSTMIASGCTAAAVVQQGFPTVFRIAWNDDDQAKAAADYIRSGLHARRAAVVRDTSIYARAMTFAFNTQFRQHGGSVVEVELPATGSVDVARTAARVRDAGAGAVFLATSRPDSAGLFVELRSSLAPLPVIGADSVLDGSGGGPPDGLVTAGLARRTGAWISEIDAGIGSPDLFENQSEDALGLYVAALNKTARGQRDGSLVIDRQSLRDALAHLEVIGSTGRISFDSRGERRHDTGAAVYSIVGGTVTLLSEHRR